jgi:hypothetical protein
MVGKAGRRSLGHGGAGIQGPGWDAQGSPWCAGGRGAGQQDPGLPAGSRAHPPPGVPAVHRSKAGDGAPPARGGKVSGRFCPPRASPWSFAVERSGRQEEAARRRFAGFACFHPILLSGRCATPTMASGRRAVNPPKNLLTQFLPGPRPGPGTWTLAGGLAPLLRSTAGRRDHPGRSRSCSHPALQAWGRRESRPPEPWNTDLIHRGLYSSVVSPGPRRMGFCPGPCQGAARPLGFRTLAHGPAGPGAPGRLLHSAGGRRRRRRAEDLGPGDTPRAGQPGLARRSGDPRGWALPSLARTLGHRNCTGRFAVHLHLFRYGAEPYP